MTSLITKTADSLLLKIRRSQLYYGRYNNTLGFRLNENYLRYAHECEAKYAREHGRLTLPPSKLLTESATIVKNAFPADKATGYSKKISAFIDGNAPCVDRPEGYSDLQIRIKDPLRSLDADLLNVLRSPKVHEELLAFFRGHYRIEWVSVFRSFPAQRAASSWLWHSDSFPPKTCKVFLHLTPATAELGATEFMNKDDTMAYRRAGYYGQYLGERYASLETFAEKHRLNYKPYHYDAAPGDATVFDMNFFHRAVSPLHDYRDVVQFFLLPNPVSWEEQFRKDGIDGLVHPKNGYPTDPRRP